MVWSEILDALRAAGCDVSQSQVRWAITSGKIPRPPLDASLRFVFDEDHLNALRQLFTSKREATNG